MAWNALPRRVSVPEPKRVTYSPNPRPYEPIKREVTPEVVEKASFQILGDL